jgi:hypothetical protein
VDERRRSIAPLVEWIAAAFAVLGLTWVIFVPIQRAFGPRVEAAITDTDTPAPPGVPGGATNIPVMLLLDGREIRTGDLHTRLDETLPPQLADGPAHLSRGQFGDRHTRAYVVDGARFYVACERLEPGGPMRVAGIYLP